MIVSKPSGSSGTKISVDSLIAYIRKPGYASQSTTEIYIGITGDHCPKGKGGSGKRGMVRGAFRQMVKEISKGNRKVKAGEILPYHLPHNPVDAVTVEEFFNRYGVTDKVSEKSIPEFFTAIAPLVGADD